LSIDDFSMVPSMEKVIMELYRVPLFVFLWNSFPILGNGAPVLETLPARVTEEIDGFATQQSIWAFIGGFPFMKPWASIKIPTEQQLPRFNEIYVFLNPLLSFLRTTASPCLSGDIIPKTFRPGFAPPRLLE